MKQLFDQLEVTLERLETEARKLEEAVHSHEPPGSLSFTQKWGDEAMRMRGFARDARKRVQKVAKVAASDDPETALDALQGAEDLLLGIREILDHEAYMAPQEGAEGPKWQKWLARITAATRGLVVTHREVLDGIGALQTALSAELERVHGEDAEASATSHAAAAAGAGGEGRPPEKPAIATVGTAEKPPPPLKAMVAAGGEGAPPQKPEGGPAAKEHTKKSKRTGCLAGRLAMRKDPQGRHLLPLGDVAVEVQAGDAHFSTSTDPDRGGFCVGELPLGETIYLLLPRHHRRSRRQFAFHGARWRGGRLRGYPHRGSLVALRLEIENPGDCKRPESCEQIEVIYDSVLSPRHRMAASVEGIDDSVQGIDLSLEEISRSTDVPDVLRSIDRTVSEGVRAGAGRGSGGGPHSPRSGSAASRIKALVGADPRDPRAFRESLARSFRSFEERGTVRYEYVRPSLTSGGAPSVVELPPAQRELASRGELLAVEIDASVTGAEPVCLNPDDDVIDSRKRMVAKIVRGIVREFSRRGGPPAERVNQDLGALLDARVTGSNSGHRGYIGALEVALCAHQAVDNLEDEGRVVRIRRIRSLVAQMRQIWTEYGTVGGGFGQRVGTLRHLLEVLESDVDKAYEELDIAGMAPADLVGTDFEDVLSLAREIAVQTGPEALLGGHLEEITLLGTEAVRVRELVDDLLLPPLESPLERPRVAEAFNELRDTLKRIAAA